MVVKFAQIRPPRRRVGAPVIVSFAAHALFLLWVILPGLPARSPSAYDQLIRPREDHLVWYNFKQKLPEVSPQTAAPNKPLWADTLAKQSIVSAPKDAPAAKQMIFHPVPELKPEPPKPLPNMIALSLPPPPPPPKPVEVKTPEAPPVKQFVRPAERQAKLVMKVQTADAPELKPTVTPALTGSKVFDQASKVMAFRPQAKPSLTASVGAMPDVPVLAGATASTANLAIVGLNPTDKLERPVTEASRKAQFSAGPQVNLSGATSAGNGSGISVPDLTIRGSANQKSKDAGSAALLARAMPPSMPTPAGVLREASREGLRGGLSEAPHESSHLGGMPVSGSPDPRFLGRQVFSMAIQSPNLTSHSGSWLMWYADRGGLTYQAKISAPQPVHKVDPKYIATAAEERVEGTVRLAFVIGRDGRVYSVEKVKGIDDRLDASAMEALRKWQFTPAVREGTPIDVDALVEIPFRLAPREKP